MVEGKLRTYAGPSDHCVFLKNIIWWCFVNHV